MSAVEAPSAERLRPPGRDVTTAGADGYVLVRVGEAVDGRYPVQVSVLDASGAEVGFPAATFGRADLPSLPDIAVDADPSVTESGLARAGTALFGLLAPGGLAQARDRAGAVPLLLDVRPAELRALPWELLRYPGGGTKVVPFADHGGSASRASLPLATDLTDLAVPIHVLVVVGDPRDPDLGADEEIDAIFAGLRGAPCCWQVDVLRGPSRKQLREHYRDVEPDILHVIGHGMDDEGAPAIEIQVGGGQTWALTAEFLTDALDRMPRLAVLNACRSGAQPAEAARLARGLSEALLDVGAAAVVSMQGDLATAPAALFAGRLYEGLAGGRRLDAAVAGARSEVRFADGLQVRARDWALPVLELRADPAAVLRRAWVRDPASVIRRHNGFMHVPRMVDRTVVRRRLQRRVGPLPGAESDTASPGDGLVFVTGAEQIGKSLLVRSFVVAQVVRGARAVYHSLDHGNHVSAADFVLGVANSVAHWLGDSTLQQDAVAALQAVLAPAGEDVYQRLRGLLVALARPAPLALVLDHVGLIDERDAFVRGLLEPAANGALPGVQLVVVDELDTLRGVVGEGQAETLLADRQIPVPAFGGQETVALVREYLARSRPDDVNQQKWDAAREKMLTWAEARALEETELEPTELLLAAMLYARGTGLVTGLVLT